MLKKYQIIKKETAFPYVKSIKESRNRIKKNKNGEKRKENSSLFLFILCLKILAKIKNKENEPLKIYYTL